MWYSSLTISVEDFRVGSKWACSASQESDLSSKTFLPSVSQPSSQPSFSALPSVFSFVMSLDTFSSIHQPDRILITFSWQAKSSSYYSGKCPFSKKLSYWSNLYAYMLVCPQLLSFMELSQQEEIAPPLFHLIRKGTIIWWKWWLALYNFFRQCESCWLCSS